MTRLIDVNILSHGSSTSYGIDDNREPDDFSEFDWQDAREPERYGLSDQASTSSGVGLFPTRWKEEQHGSYLIGQRRP